MENKLKIGIDLDDVVFEFVNPLLEGYKEKYGKDISFEEVFSYNFPTIFNISLKEVIDLIEDVFKKGKVENMSFCEFSKESILDLSKNHKIYFITSRIFREGTLESLEKFFFETNFELVFSSNPYAKTNGKTKGEICNELGIDFMIEDSKEHAEECVGKNIKVFLLDKPWNKNTESHENMIRVKNWREIMEKIR